MPEARLTGEDARHAAHGRAVAACKPAGNAVRLTDEQGLIAIAEPRGELLKPVVGLRG
jgi:hypothetical protein